MYQIFDFFKVFINRQVHLLPKVPKQSNFCRSLQNSRAEIELCANVLALCCDILYKIESTFFKIRFPKSKVFKT